ncbi:hypothetical protein AYI69_g900 [Smittium culicis]|uniref:Uncharacterized protein n=1 Tax=Smittium culicis TaxID=133412 RepID=A0A1R1YRV0_9FUNG|nr:hypothetical protein AYI69_g900 [Smittium culicis]
MFAQKLPESLPKPGQSIAPNLRSCPIARLLTITLAARWRREPRVHATHDMDHGNCRSLAITATAALAEQYLPE